MKDHLREARNLLMTLSRSSLITAVFMLFVCSSSIEIEGYIVGSPTLPLKAAFFDGRCGLGRRRVPISNHFASNNLPATRERIAPLCAAYPESNENRTDEKMSVKIVGACVIRDGSILMVERRQRSRGYWEFPGFLLSCNLAWIMLMLPSRW